jgi:hypothetical protein
MNKLISAFTPAAIVLAASLSCGAAYAADSQADANGAAVAQTQPADPHPSTAAATQASHGLTRQDVRQQLIQAEKDGTISRLNATVYFGS